MLAELHVRNLGIIEELDLELPSGLVALTGETGAGKTLVVEAVELLTGGKANPSLVRTGASEALVEARFVAGDGSDGGDGAGECILARSISATGGRSRAWLDGRMVPVARLGEVTERLVDLYGQHLHQSLLDRRVQREALDRFGGVEGAGLAEARRAIAVILEGLASLGGDDSERAREIDILRYQIEEIDQACITDPEEPALLAAEEERLAGGERLREAAAGLALSLGRAEESLGEGLRAIRHLGPLSVIESRVGAMLAELGELTHDLHREQEGFEDDPDRLQAVQERRRMLASLQRKYGDPQGGLEEVLEFAKLARDRLSVLENADAEAASLQHALREAREQESRAAREMRRLREEAAPRLATAIEERLAAFGMANAAIGVSCEGADPGDAVTFLLAANRGEGLRPLAAAASGGELARVMLALRLVLGDAEGDLPASLVFDEVDSGIGGASALTLAGALRELAGTARRPGGAGGKAGTARRSGGAGGKAGSAAPSPAPSGGSSLGSRGTGARQVLVVTHLAQVAAFADAQFVVTKVEAGGRVRAEVRRVEGEERSEEVARMLSGQPGSVTARQHALELLQLGRIP